MREHDGAEASAGRSHQTRPRTVARNTASLLENERRESMKKSHEYSAGKSQV